MYKPDENDIDRLSRDAAERYNAPGTPAWDSLRQTLDKELPRKEEKKRRGFFFFIILPGLLLGGSAVLYGIHTHNKNKETPLAATIASNNKKGNGNVSSATTTKKETATLNSTRENNTPVNIAANKPASSTKNIEDRNNKLAPSATASTHALNSNQQIKDNTVNKKLKPNINSLTKQPATEANTPAAIAKNTVSVKNHLANTTTAGSLNIVTAEKGIHTKPYTSAAGADKQKPVYGSAIRKKQSKDLSASDGTADEGSIAATGKKNKHPNRKTGVKNKEAAGTDKTTAAVDASSNNTKEDPRSDMDAGNKTNEPTIAAALPDALNNKTTPSIDTTGKTVIAADKKDTIKTIAAKKKSKSKNNRAINIGLTAGLDLSTVKFTHNDNLGYNIGIMGGYQFSKHWSVYTGVIYTKKIYELNGNDYHPPEHYWTQYVKLETVEGYCRMWELPLQARYTFSTRSKTAFFLSTGLSSYFMKKQAYNYSFKTITNTQGTAAWASDSTFTHVFSILNLSAGFERQVGKHLNLQVEPYAKIPLGGIGFGNIRLSSFGVNLTVQYRKPVKR